LCIRTRCAHGLRTAPLPAARSGCVRRRSPAAGRGAHA
jgi:hypothetical protein